MHQTPYLIVPLLQAFFWFDDGLQAYLERKGWSHVTRPQSMIMINVLTGTNRPSDIARNLGVSRQAIHTTINQMIALGILEMQDDPDDRRSKIVVLSDTGNAMRMDANAAVEALTAELARRIGKANVLALQKIFAADWGAPALSLAPPPEAAPQAKTRRRK